MKIGIDATIFNRKDFTGISRSIHEVLRIWATKYSQHEFYLISNQEIFLEFDLPSNWHVVIKQWYIKGMHFWWWFEREKLIKDLALDVYWGTSYSLPRRSGKASYYVSVYDMALFKFKKIGDPKGEANTRKQTARACKRADKIIAISEATATDIVEILNVDMKKIEVSYCGGLPSNYELSTSNMPENNDLLFNQKFFLFISTIEPRKNIITIVKAFEKYKADYKSNMRLVLAGRIGWRCDEILSAIENSPYRNDIIIPGFITDNDKKYLLTKATAFVYPSLYEGFGIPILEAYAYKLPVITARVSSLPEVAGSCGIYIKDPEDFRSLAEQMNLVVNFTAKEKKDIELKIQEQLAKFSWDKNALEIMEIFEKKR